MVVGNTRSQLRQLVPMGHVGVLGTHIGMAVVDILLDEHQTLVATMELDTAVQLTSQPTQPFEPTMETWLKLSS